ncbi:MAG: 3-oxoacyl-[acyl-carrier protein] reductase [Saliniramus fredricksonii]|uniref:3-oxoacyl-[acyl-carrier protein] reductase n=1 Tax=Saliniramus fredricksonii TaxID=1653334 RepID=A0A0P8A3I2_9HYPH|nr:SDR family oxidoreductase [Saliniramus fredricksonii]KPQ11999.1 MAG: 3-oxoacyl-[acyl-carrier protein] reductase [Saliniramus fredricksonii]SCC81506.1 3-oxoacyl-[acyl-carrier protein] reductase [Saliniramus fredricksonii]
MPSTSWRLGPQPGARIAVLGACGGIGQALVAALNAIGCRVFPLDLPRSLESSALQGTEAAIPVDATSESALTEAFATLEQRAGGLEGFVHLAGFTAAPAPLATQTRAVFDDVVTGNLDSTFLAARAALPLLARGSDASLVLTSSGLAAKATPGYGPYAAAKAGVIALTRVLAIENAPHIRVNAVAPSAVETPFLEGGMGRDPHGRGFDREGYAKTIPLGRIAAPDDVTGPLLFLLGPASGYMTGQVLHVNGGSLMP